MLSRELLYTALARAKREAMFYGVPGCSRRRSGGGCGARQTCRIALWVEPRTRRIGERRDRRSEVTGYIDVR